MRTGRSPVLGLAGAARSRPASQPRQPASHNGTVIDAEPALHLRLRHPDLDFWVDARLRWVGGAWLAVADLAGTPEPAAATSAELALYLSLWPLGPDIAADLVNKALLPRG